MTATAAAPKHKLSDWTILSERCRVCTDEMIDVAQRVLIERFRALFELADQQRRLSRTPAEVSALRDFQAKLAETLGGLDRDALEREKGAWTYEHAQMSELTSQMLRYHAAVQHRLDPRTVALGYVSIPDVPSWIQAVMVQFGRRAWKHPYLFQTEGLSSAQAAEHEARLKEMAAESVVAAVKEAVARPFEPAEFCGGGDDGGSSDGDHENAEADGDEEEEEEGEPKDKEEWNEAKEEEEVSIEAEAEDSKEDASNDEEGSKAEEASSDPPENPKEEREEEKEDLTRYVDLPSIASIEEAYTKTVTVPGNGGRQSDGSDADEKVTVIAHTGASEDEDDDDEHDGPSTPVPTSPPPQPSRNKRSARVDVFFG